MRGWREKSKSYRRKDGVRQKSKKEVGFLDEEGGEKKKTEDIMMKETEAQGGNHRFNLSDGDVEQSY